MLYHLKALGYGLLVLTIAVAAVAIPVVLVIYKPAFAIVLGALSIVVSAYIVGRELMED